MKANQIDDREVSPMPFIPNQTSPGAPVAQAPAGAGLMPPGRKERYCLRAFLYGLGISLIFFLPFIIFDNGYFLFYGDFNVQQSAAVISVGAGQPTWAPILLAPIRSTCWGARFSG